MLSTLWCKNSGTKTARAEWLSPWDPSTVPDTKTGEWSQLLQWCMLTFVTAEGMALVGLPSKVYVPTKFFQQTLSHWACSELHTIDRTNRHNPIDGVRQENLVRALDVSHRHCGHVARNAMPTRVVEDLLPHDTANTAHR